MVCFLRGCFLRTIYMFRTAMVDLNNKVSNVIKPVLYVLLYSELVAGKPGMTCESDLSY